MSNIYGGKVLWLFSQSYWININYDTKSKEKGVKNKKVGSLTIWSNWFISNIYMLDGGSQKKPELTYFSSSVLDDPQAGK